MQADDFGRLAGDDRFEDDRSALHVYAARFYVEELADGNFGLRLDGESWSGDLSEMEERLWDWALGKTSPDMERQAVLDL